MKSGHEKTDSDQHKKAPPSHRYERYNHPSENEHRTAEQFKWRREYVVNCLALLFSVVTAVLAYGAYWQSRRQADAAQEQIVAIRDDQRAWLKVVAVAERAERVPPNQIQPFGWVTVVAHINVTNVGHTPALNVRHRIFGSIGIDGVVSRQEKSCGDTTTLSSDIMFPGETTDSSELYGGRYIASDFLNATNQSGSFFVFGCEVYKTFLGGPDHITNFLYEVWRLYDVTSGGEQIHQRTSLLPFDGNLTEIQLKVNKDAFALGNRVN